MNMVSLFNQIIQKNPPISDLNLYKFSDYINNESEGKVILETLLNSNIRTVQHLNLGGNPDWFSHEFKEDPKGAVEMQMRSKPKMCEREKVWREKKRTNKQMQQPKTKKAAFQKEQLKCT